MDGPTIMIIGGLLMAVLSLSYRLSQQPKKPPKQGIMVFISIRNKLKFSLFNSERCLNTYMMDFRNTVTLTLPSGEYRLEYSATSGEAGTLIIDLKNQDRLKIQLPPV